MSKRDSKRAEKAREAEIREWLSYDLETGIFRWKKQRPGGSKKVGDVAGYVHKITGYVHIQVLGRIVSGQRLAWWFVHGEWPALLMDHVNGNRADNRIANLRQANPSQNTANHRGTRRPKNGYFGVHAAHGSPGWVARVFYRGRTVGLGTFPTPEEAARAYDAKVRELQGDFATCNFP